jgi:hypothetical protein
VRRFRPKYTKFFINGSQYIAVEAIQRNADIFRKVAETYKSDIVLVNSLKYAAELCDEILAGVQANNMFQTATAYKRYAYHFNNTLRLQAKARGVKLAG